MKILVTSGGTRERIDSVRFLTNFSTGRTGAFITDFFAERRAEVSYLYGPTAALPSQACELVAFDSFADLDQLLQVKLGQIDFDAIIHAAAVGDFSVAASPGKLDSSQALHLELKPNFKIVERLKSYSRNPRIRIVAFKLTASPDTAVRLKQILKLSLNDDIDYVVHNDLNEITDSRHLSRIFRRDACVREGQSKIDLARNLFELLHHQGQG